MEAEQKMPFRDYVLSCKNSFPQTFAEFPSLGAFAWQFFREWYEWVDLDELMAAKMPIPKDKQTTFWSHQGITDSIKAQIEQWLA